MLKDNTWNKVAKKYHQRTGESGDFCNKIFINPVLIKLLGNIKNKHILDLACGQGYFSRILSKKGAKVVGIDISNNLLDIAREIEDQNPLGIKYFLNNSANLKDIKSSLMDIIVSNMAFHDIRNIRKTIKECARVLKSSGRLIFSILNPLIDISERKKDKKGYFNKMRKYKSNIETEHPMFKNSGIKLYHRPLGFYFEELFKTDFLISGFEEISIKHDKDKAKSKYKKEFPEFLIIECIKR